ncbi:Carboxylesterase 1 [Hondaea fermentalgiana]|uniref:Carboxylic ester hydrolase n=1 Tax=Hondaea fermentalgiana TaxID=2315210 RepID=A0A2R5GBA2_9STRA|nr:Carboxylesterase 1 [Hondaea fermentalgiana]|eukprot:GBG27629.1 Carboxylesterase 1 [Hondaea fermentalgiana]
MAWRAQVKELVTRALLPSGAEGLVNVGKTKSYEASQILCWPDVMYTSEKDPCLQVDVFVPGEAVVPFPRSPTPVLLMLHGGGFKLGSRKLPSIVKFSEMCAETHGITVMSAGYRMGASVSLQEQIADVTKAVCWVRANAASFGGDPDQVFVAGHSAGAFLAMHAGLAFRDGGVRGIIGVSGIYDLENLSSMVPRVGPAYVSRVVGTDAPASRFALANSSRLAAYKERMLLLMPQNELPLLKGDAFAIFNSPRRAKCTLEEIRDCNHWSIITQPATAALTAAFVRNELHAPRKSRR